MKNSHSNSIQSSHSLSPIVSPFKILFLVLGMLVATTSWGQMGMYQGVGYRLDGPDAQFFNDGPNTVTISSCMNNPLNITVDDQQSTFGVYNTYSESPSQTFQGNNYLMSYYGEQIIKNVATQQVLCTLMFQPKQQFNIETIKLQSSQIKNDTLYICAKEETIKLNTLLSSDYNYNICEIDLGNSPNYGDYELRVNGKTVSFYNNTYDNMKDGDTLQVVIRSNPSLFNNNFNYNYGCSNMYCFQQNKDSVVSQTVVVKLKQNEVLPKPTFLNNVNTICAGDTATLLRDPSLKQVYTYNSYNYSYDDTLSTQKILQPGIVHLQSRTVRANGCYALSDTVSVKRKDCGYLLIRGYVYQGKYSYSAYEKGKVTTFANVKVSIKVPGTNDYVYTFTNEAGVYEFKIDSTMRATWVFTVAVADKEYFASYNEVNDYYKYKYIELNLSTYPLVTNDLASTLNSGRNRPGFTMPIFLTVANKGKTTNTGTVELELDPNYTYIEATPTPKTIAGNVLTWDLDSIAPSQFSHLSVSAKLLPSIALGTVLKSKMTLVPAIKDIDSVNDTSALEAIVTGSFDPNDIAVNPTGDGPEGFIDNTTNLSYTIRCQNMGTDTAFTVVIKNKISHALDFKTFKMIDASHNYKLSMHKDTVIWTFHKIHLLDNKSNEPLSHAFVKYTIEQKANNSPLTEIKNDAGIYFDYNAVVPTNVVLNTIKENITGIEASNSTHFLIYPNPSEGNITIKANESGVVSIFNSLGELVYKDAYESQKMIDLSQLPKGVYVIQGKTVNEVSTTKIILK